MKKSPFGALALVVKLGPKLLAVFGKLLKSLKLGKVALAGASFAGYSAMFTWQFALLILFSLFVHESGHIWAMRRCGLRIKGIYFIPFFGAAAVTDQEFPSRGAESFIALMGPVWGLGLALLTAVGYLATHNPLFAAAAGWMTMINLFNLLPINPLDGGRVLKSIAFSINSSLGIVLLILGMLFGAYLAVTMGFVLFVFLLVIGGFELAGEYKQHRKALARAAAVVQPEDAPLPVFAGAYDPIGTSSGAFGDTNISTMEAAAPEAAVEEETVLLKPLMNRRGLALSVAGYVGLIAGLWFLGDAVSHIPAADIALSVLRGN